MIKRIIAKLKRITNDIARKKINKKLIKRLKNTNMTLISSNCNGGILLHDLKCKFNSPFVNLFLKAEDYIKLLENFESYMNREVQFIESEQRNYPVGKLGDISLHFLHYKNKEEAYEKWNLRKQRIDMSNFFIIFTDRDGCNKELLVRFENLPYKNKVVFVHNPMPEIKSSFYIKGFENKEFVGALYEYKGWNGKKYYDEFDFVSWFNIAVEEK